MKKAILEIIFLGLAAVFTCGILFYASCKRTYDCSQEEIIPNEPVLLARYNQGDKVVFKNDSSNVYDTMCVTQKDYGSYYEDLCKKIITTSINASFTFSHLSGCSIQIRHNVTPWIWYPDNISFQINSSLQTLKVNSITYYDVYYTSIDSNTIG